MTSTRFAYAQARLQARHAERLAPADWIFLQTHRSLQSFLQAARATHLSRWLRFLDREPDAHAVEAALDLAFRAHVEEVATWLDEPWDRSVRWTSWLPLLERIGEQPKDPYVARRLMASDALPLLDGGAGQAWYRQFRLLWPRSGATELDELIELVARHLAAMAKTENDTDGFSLRAALGHELQRAFRRHPASPVAAFSHLGLTLLELERLRGAILVRALFPRARTDVIWA